MVILEDRDTERGSLHTHSLMEEDVIAGRGVSMGASPSDHSAASGPSATAVRRSEAL